MASITTETLRKIENGKVLPTHTTLEILSTHLKTDLNSKLLNYRISDYNLYLETENEIEFKLDNGDYGYLENKLEVLDNILLDIEIDNYIYIRIKQLRLLVESILIKINQRDYKKSLSILIDAMKITTPDYELNSYNEFVYSKMEVRILMNMALLHNKLDSKITCLNILKFCLRSIGPEEINCKLKIIYNISYSCHRLDLHKKALYYADKGISTSLEHDSLRFLALLYSRKGMAEFFLNIHKYKYSFKNAFILYDIAGQDNLKEILELTLNKYNIILN